MISLDLPILVVDDFGVMRRILRNQLWELGFTDVVEAPDGASALVQLTQRPFGLVISDWNMEPVSGQLLLTAIREMPDLAKLPFLLVTAESRAEAILKARAIGISAHLIKPFGIRALRDRIEAALNDRLPSPHTQLQPASALVR